MSEEEKNSSGEHKRAGLAKSDEKTNKKQKLVDNSEFDRIDDMTRRWSCLLVVGLFSYTDGEEGEMPDSCFSRITHENDVYHPESRLYMYSACAQYSLEGITVYPPGTFSFWRYAENGCSEFGKALFAIDFDSTLIIHTDISETEDVFMRVCTYDQLDVMHYLMKDDFKEYKIPDLSMKGRLWSFCDTFIFGEVLIDYYATAYPEKNIIFDLRWRYSSSRQKWRIVNILWTVIDRLDVSLADSFSDIVIVTQ